MTSRRLKRTSSKLKAQRRQRRQNRRKPMLRKLKMHQRRRFRKIKLNRRS